MMEGDKRPEMRTEDGKDESTSRGKTEMRGSETNEGGTVKGEHVASIKNPYSSQIVPGKEG